MEAGDAVVKPSEFHSQRNMSCPHIIGATSICGSSLGFPLCSRKGAANVVGRIKYQKSAAGEHVGMNSARTRQLKDRGRRELHNIGLYARHRCAGIDLGTAFKAGLRLYGEPAIDVETCAKQKSSGFGDAVLNAAATATLREKAGALHAELQPMAKR